VTTKPRIWLPKNTKPHENTGETTKPQVRVAKTTKPQDTTKKKTTEPKVSLVIGRDFPCTCRYYQKLHSCNELRGFIKSAGLRVSTCAVLCLVYAARLGNSSQIVFTAIPADPSGGNSGGLELEARSMPGAAR
jgi:hypothetical protein